MYLKENYEPRGTDNGQGQKSEHTLKLEAIVFITLQIFLKTTGFWNTPRIFRSLSWGVSSRVTGLDQSRAVENILLIKLKQLNPAQAFSAVF